MIFPSPAQRRDWHANEFEGHAPIAHMHLGRWVAACTCGCIDPDEPGVLTHRDLDDAAEQAAHILAGRIHGPAHTET